MFPILWGLLQSIVFTVFSNAGGVLLSKKKHPCKKIKCWECNLNLDKNDFLFEMMVPMSHKALQTSQSLFEKGTRRIPPGTGPVFPFNRTEKRRGFFENP